MLICKICIARRLVVNIFPWCNANFVPSLAGRWWHAKKEMGELATVMILFKQRKTPKLVTENKGSLPHACLKCPSLLLCFAETRKPQNFKPHLTLIYPTYFEDVQCQSGVNYIYER